MTEMIDSLVKLITLYLQQFGIPFGIFIIILESIIPALPLGVFIAFNTIAFGNLVGFIISYIGTVLGCLISFYICRKFLSKFISKKAKKHDRLNRVIKSVKKTKFTNLVLLTALPFTPAFLINIACGITKMNFKKFFCSILISKTMVIYFWGFIGKSLLESITDVVTLLRIVVLMAMAFILSKIVNKKFNIE